MVWLVAIREGGLWCVEEGEACVCRAHHAVGCEAELRGAGALPGCMLMVQSKEVKMLSSGTI